ncbi:MAG TPA: hypothetical protein ENN61_04130 [Bacteroidaceae bacterium]|nr:hypothetical protein [Bacteroidaceae bacterium]
MNTNDSISYVYTLDGRKQIVVLGASNENNIVVDMGLNKGEKLYLSLPENPDNFPFDGLELIPEIEKRKADNAKKILEMNNLRQNHSRPRMDSANQIRMVPGQMPVRQVPASEN